MSAIAKLIARVVRANVAVGPDGEDERESWRVDALAAKAEHGLRSSELRRVLSFATTTMYELEVCAEDTDNNPSWIAGRTVLAHSAKDRLYEVATFVDRENAEQYVVAMNALRNASRSSPGR